MRVRDTQRSKVYEAERAAFRDHVEANEGLREVADIKAFVRHVFSLKRVQDAFPRAVTEWRSGAPNVHDGRGRRRACGGINFISMPLWSRCKWIVLHELAHTISFRTQYHIAAHGWEYAATYLTLVRCVLGVEAHDLLKAQFKAHRVRFRAPTKRAPLSPERRAQLVATLAAARASRSTCTAQPA
jgi:putative metallohydrolase (TIGR04338 family)